jgi:Hemolysins and related proteins containing CBS domains
MAYFELFIIIALILLNGFLSLSEAAVTSSRKSRLKSAAKNNQQGAKAALNLVENPPKFLSAVQISTTAIGIFLGIFSGVTLSDDFAALLSKIEIFQPYALLLSVLIIVLAVTFFLIVFGELIPRKIGRSQPEKVASVISGPMNVFSKIMFPISFFVSGAANLLGRLFGISSNEPTATEEDVKEIVQEGLEGGSIDETEQNLVEHIFSLDDRKVSSILTHKNDIVWIDISVSASEILGIIKENPYSVYPVADKEIDNIVGVLYLKDLAGKIDPENFDLQNIIRPADFLPDNMSILSVLENFQSAKIRYAFITDEFGGVQGIVTISDVFEALVGDVSARPSPDEYEIIPRGNDSWLIDGQYPFYDFLKYFDLLDYHAEYSYKTLSGLILDQLEKMPHAGDKFDWLHFEIEVLDMDAVRIDKVMVSVKEPTDIGSE